MHIYRVHFTWKDKEYALKAKSLDLTHPYFVCIKDLVLPEESPVLITPADDEIRRIFEDVRQLMVPFQAVSLIEEFDNDPDSGKQQSTVSKGEVVVDPRFRKKT